MSAAPVRLTANRDRTVSDSLRVLAAATFLTVAAAWPVVWHPTEQIFGAELVGRHHDPFTVIQQFAGDIAIGERYFQPATDWTGRLVATVIPPIAAYNLIVLLTFPLAAWFAYLLARELTGSRAGAAVAAFVFAFAPVHVAHAAYHPHIAQVQWIPLYFLALWRCVHGVTLRRILGLLAAAAVAVLANDYHVLLLAPITPIAAVLFWYAPANDGARGRVRDLVATMALLVVPSVVAYAWLRRAVPSAFAITAARDDLFRYSARWWSYLVPPANHPLAGTGAGAVWTNAGIGDGLLEQQVFVGVSVIALSIVALVHRNSRVARRTLVALAAIAALAVLCSLSPERRVFGITFVRPSALLYVLMPMFRSYARFAVIVQLALAVLAGVGASALWRTPRTRVFAVALLLLLVVEYAPVPAASRDVLPTSAHRFLVTRLGPARSTSRADVFDCTQPGFDADQTAWLAGYRISYLGSDADDCGEPALSSKLAALRYRYLLTRRGAPERATLEQARGWQRVYRGDDADVWAVTADAAPVYVAAVHGLWPREYDGADSWRWLGPPGQLVLTNATAAAVTGVLSIDVAAFAHVRHAAVTIDGAPQRTLAIASARATVAIGPLTLSPGPHVVTIMSVEPATSPRSLGLGADDRALTFQLFAWRWQ